MELIEKQAAIDALDDLCDRECEYSKKQRHVMCGACHLASAFDVVEQLHAQPEIIRCKDCNHFYKDNLNQWCFLGKYGVKENDFCSRAERGTDE